MHDFDEMEDNAIQSEEDFAEGWAALVENYHEGEAMVRSLYAAHFQR